MSNPRAFVVGDLRKVREKEPNNDVRRPSTWPSIAPSTAPSMPAPTSITMSSRARRDSTSWSGCLASSIDSRPQCRLDLYDADGRWLGENRNYDHRDALLDCTLPHDGDYYVRVCHFAYTEGSPQHFYRLSLSTRRGLMPSIRPSSSPAR